MIDLVVQIVLELIKSLPGSYNKRIHQIIIDNLLTNLNDNEFLKKKKVLFSNGEKW